MQTLKTNSEQGLPSHKTQPLCLFTGEQGNVNSVYSEFQHLFRNPSDLLRRSRGSDVLHISPRIMINKEILNITSKARFSGRHRNFSPTQSVVSDVHTCRRNIVREREGAPMQGHQVIWFFLLGFRIAPVGRNLQSVCSPRLCRTNSWPGAFGVSEGNPVTVCLF